VKSKVKNISSSPMVFMYWFQCSTFMILMGMVVSYYFNYWWEPKPSTKHTMSRIAHAKRISSWRNIVHHTYADFLNQLQWVT
jgi:hypothetical protein